MRKNFILSLIFSVMFFIATPVLAEGDPQISLSPANGSVIEGGLNGYGKSININYSVSNLESCWWRGTWTGFEIWILVDGNVVSYYRDPERPAFFTYYGLTYSSSLNYYLSQGAHTIQVNAKSFEVKFDIYLDINQSSTINTVQIVHPPIITADNNFTDVSGVTHGLVTVSGRGTPTAPYTFEINSGQSVTFTAVSPQTSNTGYNMTWNNGTTNPSIWERNGGYIYPNQAFLLAVTQDDNLSIYKANLKKICKPNFQNSFVGVGNGGVIKVNNTQYSSPTNQFDVVELNPITGTAVYQAINEIGYTFNHWSDNSTSVTKTFNPGSTQTYTAYYTGKPLTTNRALHTGTTVNQPIVLYWNEHPNVNVTQYNIWRQVKHNGVMGVAQLIATTNRGTTSYVDYDYNLTRSYTNDLLYYDVRPYYSTEGTYSDNDWFAVFGVLMPKTSDSTSVAEMELENSLANFPNPFNPSTNISFSIKEAGHVNIKVFDLIGQQVAELVNEEKEAGSYQISFNASHLPSGIYIYTINAGIYSQTRKMLLMK
ncbi:MAG: T9SS type A sorting domain-containing protein [Ignavibacteriales bacterium]|nr:T9SS type A sorting domain-containing protein [Ignavibacteriales bacterium]